MTASQATIKAIYVLVMAYPGKELSKETMAFYADELSDIPSDILALAIKAYINGASAAFFPAIGQIRAEANKIQSAAQRLPTAEQAWVETTGKSRRFVTKRCDTFVELSRAAFNLTSAAEYFRAVGKVEDHAKTCTECSGGYEDDKFSHPLIEKIARDLGWPHMETDNASADRARFIDAYNRAVKTAQDMQGLPPAVRDGINALTDRLKSPAIAAGRGGEALPIAALLQAPDDREEAFERDERGTVWQR